MTTKPKHCITYNRSTKHADGCSQRKPVTAAMPVVTLGRGGHWYPLFVHSTVRNDSIDNDN